MAKVDTLERTGLTQDRGTDICQQVRDFVQGISHEDDAVGIECWLSTRLHPGHPRQLPGMLTHQHGACRALRSLLRAQVTLTTRAQEVLRVLVKVPSGAPTHIAEKESWEGVSVLCEEMGIPDADTPRCLAALTLSAKQGFPQLQEASTQSHCPNR